MECACACSMCFVLPLLLHFDFFIRPCSILVGFANKLIRSYLFTWEYFDVQLVFCFCNPRLKDLRRDCLIIISFLIFYFCSLFFENGKHAYQLLLVKNTLKANSMFDNHLVLTIFLFFIFEILEKYMVEIRDE